MAEHQLAVPAGRNQPPVNGPASSGPAARTWQLPNALRLIGIVSALLGILGAMALVYLVATSGELFFGSVVAPSDETSYFMFAWVVFVVCGAQLFALVTNHTSRVLATTVIRIATVAFSMLITPTLDLDVSIGVESLIQLAANLAIAATILSRRRSPTSTGRSTGA